MDLCIAFPVIQTDDNGRADLAYLSNCLAYHATSRTIVEQQRLCRVMLELSDFLFEKRFEKRLVSTLPLRFVVLQDEELFETDVYAFYLISEANQLAGKCIAELTELLDLGRTAPITLSPVTEEICDQAALLTASVLGVLYYCLQLIQKRCVWAMRTMKPTCVKLEERYHMIRAIRLWMAGSYVCLQKETEGRDAGRLKRAANLLHTCESVLIGKLGGFGLTVPLKADCRRMKLMAHALWCEEMMLKSEAAALMKQAAEAGQLLTEKQKLLVRQNLKSAQSDSEPGFFEIDRSAFTGSSATVQRPFTLAP